jgi:hypothetical protein
MAHDPKLDAVLGPYADMPHFLEVEREMIRDQILFPKLREFGGCNDGKERGRQYDCERGNCACAQLADTLVHDIAFWKPAEAGK